MDINTHQYSSSMDNLLYNINGFTGCKGSLLRHTYLAGLKLGGTPGTAMTWDQESR